MKKTFVLDTNVILHDSSSIFQFDDNDVVIPITVIEEIDAFKRGFELKNFHAREFVRTLDDFPAEKLVNSGANMGEGRGKISILAHYPEDPEVKQAFVEHKADHRILSAALYLQKNFPEKHVVMVSKDVNLRLKAKSLSLNSQDYYNDKIEDVDKLFRGKELIEPFDVELIDRLYEDPYEFSAAEADLENAIPNEYFILRNNGKSALATYNHSMGTVVHVEKQPAYGIQPRNAEQTFALHALMNDDVQLVTISGKAGTGKTLLALASALEQRQKFRQILLARPIVALSNKDLGYLPGDIESKIDPYMQPLFDNLGVIRNQFRESDRKYILIQEMLENGKLEISPLAYIRGRSLNHIFFIIDEAQNLTPHEVKTIITRAGEGTKIVFTGDIYQIDSPYLDSRSTGLSYLIDRMKNQPLHAHITLEKGERSALAELASDLL